MYNSSLKERTKQLAVRVVKFGDYLLEFGSGSSKILANQIIRSGTSVGANYRAASRAKSTADFINKLKIVEEEADETIFWIEILEATDKVESSRVSDLKREANEILAMVVASIIKSRENQKKIKNN